MKMNYLERITILKVYERLKNPNGICINMFKHDCLKAT